MCQTFKLSIDAREDGTLEAAYIQLSQAKVARTAELIPSVLLVDFDRDENVVGVEILAALDMETVQKVAKKLKAKQRKSFNNVVERYAPRSLVT